MRSDLLVWAILGHLIGDYLFQTKWMAENKASKFLPLMTHSLIYTFFVALSTLPAGGISWPGLILIFLGHLIIDRRIFIRWWTKRITCSNEFWLQVMVDQTWHVLILAIAVLIA